MATPKLSVEVLDCHAFFAGAEFGQSFSHRFYRFLVLFANRILVAPLIEGIFW